MAFQSVIPLKVTLKVGSAAQYLEGRRETAGGRTGGVWSKVGHSSHGSMKTTLPWGSNYRDNSL